ncbi:hypothetical protein [Veronia pacifica]|uniref:Uncharacterized protein n=1 Tax=Veronia pacifica TaxID=1080227 RepID=A0A1C3EF07_9GAMM|nr:hypothetical protein [Veronia pacifica]ODA31826.1 hypothetical protein A8L45_15145 [Veronia pacifica]
MPFLILFFLASLVIVSVLGWNYFFPEPLVNTTWSCNSYVQFSQREGSVVPGIRHEYDTLIFLSGKDARLIKRGYQQLENDRQRGYQIDYTINYKQTNDTLSLTFSDIDWVWGDIDKWKQALKSEKGVSAIFNYHRDGDHLFLWTGKHGNRMVCSRYIEDDRDPV